ncbi:MAG: hypothetical protein ABI690_30580 [Chloroflexota bacterium]
MNRSVRSWMFIISAVQLIFAVLYLIQPPFAIQMWPFPAASFMTYILVASFFAAAGVSTGWCAWKNEAGALGGIGCDYITIFGPLAIFAIQTGTIPFAIACVIGAIFGLWLLLWSQRIPIRDARRMPRVVYGSFMVFIVALILAGGALIFKTPNILPWALTPELSVVCGWMFLGAATYFAYGLARPSWGNAVGQLAGFLAYDVILIIPFLQRLPTIAPEFKISLIIYLVVVTYSGLLAIYYLFVNRATRLLGVKSA